MTPKTAIQPENSEIMEAIHFFATSVDQRFAGIEGRLGDMEGRLGNVESSMVTKDYLDDKLSDLRGDLVVLTRKEDTKLHTLVDILHSKHIIDEGDVRRVDRLEPFAR